MSSRALVLVLVVALLFRVALLLVVLEKPERALRRDSSVYLFPAVNVLEGNGFSLSQEAPYKPTAFVTPTYPLFLASARYLLGDNPFAIAALQVIIDMATVLIVFLIGRYLFSDSVAVAGALLYALSLVAVVHSVFVLTETLFTFLVVFATGTAILYRTSRRKLWLVAAGVLSGLAILCRPIGVFFPLSIVLAIALIHRRRLGALLVSVVIYLLVTVVVILPWLIRNERALGFPTLSTISNYNLLLYNAVALVADRDAVGQASARDQMVSRVETELAERGWTDDEALWSELYGKWGREIIAADIGRYAIVHLKNDLNNLLPAAADFLELLGVTEGAKGTLSVLNQHGIAAAVDHYFEGRAWLLVPLLPFGALLVLTYLGSAVGTISLLRGRRWFSLALLLLPALYFLLIPGAVSNPRFRVPAMPYLSLLAGSGIIFAGSWISLRRAARLDAAAPGA